MRSSQLFFPTLKESPADAEIISHQLMLRSGLIRKLGAGLYSWLPLGLRILRKVETVIREEMNAIGAQELLMPMVQPASLWQETERWEQFGPLLLKIKDSNKRDFCLGPTHEEVITDLMRGELQSYKQLPICLYQIQTKFRDEIRPRFGVMRAREFLMKDAYSFHVDAASLQEMYDKMYHAYSRIFTRLGLKFRAVLADTGSIGGSQSHEFHVLAESGEDCIVFSDSSQYAANIELAEAVSPTPTKATPQNKAYQTVTTPGIRNVAGQAKHLQIKEEDILKTMLVKGQTKEHPVVALLLRGNHELNPVKAEKHPLVASPLTLITPEEVQALAGCEPGFVGPIGLSIPLIADRAVPHMHNFLCGANKTDTHYLGVYWERDCPLKEIMDLRKVLPGDPSPDGKGRLQFTRGIEVGHIFQLGDKYSRAMKAEVLDESGKPRTLTMGCYGIGVSRIVAASIEQHHDQEGIIWPTTLAPFQVVLIPIGWQKSKEIQKEAEALYTALGEAGIEVLFEDRDLRPGVLFRDMDLIGIPHRLVLSDKHLSNNMIEYKSRTETTSELINRKEIVSFIKERLVTKSNEFNERTE